MCLCSCGRKQTEQLFRETKLADVAMRSRVQSKRCPHTVLFSFPLFFTMTIFEELFFLRKREPCFAVVFVFVFICASCYRSAKKKEKLINTFF